MNPKTLSDIEVGDQVLWTGRYNNRILTVTRLTKTTIICGFEKFRKDSGNSIPLFR